MPFHKKFGIDLGTSMLKIYSAQQDTIINEKNMIAIRNKNQIIAFGNEAYEIFEKNPSNVSVISPMLNGKIADVQNTELILNLLLKKAGAGSLFANDLYLAVPADMSEIERRAFYTMGSQSRKNRIYMVDKSIADAVALGIPLNKTKGSMIVNIGAQSTEISVIEQGRVILSKIVEIGGNHLNEAIQNDVRRNYNLNIGRRTSRRLKLSLSYLKTDIKEARKIVGVDSLTGLPAEAVISSSDVHASILGPLKHICEEILFFLERTPPQVYQNITDEGIFLSGGSTRLPDIDWFICRQTGRRIRLSRFYDLSTVYGLKEIIASKPLQKWIK